MGCQRGVGAGRSARMKGETYPSSQFDRESDRVELTMSTERKRTMVSNGSKSMVRGLPMIHARTT